MSTATPAIVRVTYRDHGDDEDRTFTAALAARQYDGLIGLVVNEAAWADESACRWQMSWDRISRVEVIRAAHEPSVIEQFLAAVARTRWETVVYEALAHIGGPVQHRDVADIVRYDHGWDVLEPHQIYAALQSLKAKGWVTLTQSAGLASGVVTITGRYREEVTT